MPRSRPRNRLLLLTLAVSSVSGTLHAQDSNSAACAPCHRGIWEKYRQTGMGRSFYRPSPATNPEVSSAPATYYHAPSNSYFLMLRRGSEYYQQRYQLDSQGRPVNVLEKRIDYVMGSGNHSRAYLHRTAVNTLIELPLAWYAEKGGYFAMNPGYDRPDHDDFRRPITYDCMFCHNAYPRIPAQHTQEVYDGPLPEGIGCQRCHGAGAAHVQAAQTTGSTRQAIRNAILNPARLNPQRQLDLCMSCHLETTSFPLPNALQRYDRGPFSYRPGEPLEAFLLNFDHAPGAGRADKFEIVNAAYRLRRSACFLKSNDQLLCTTCHNPHDAPRGDAAATHYNNVCRQCHAAAFRQQVAAGKHTRAADCIACHMPKRRTEDVIHVVATDHLIQRHKPAGDPLAERSERQDSYRGPVVLYYPEKLAPTPENELLLAVAQVKQSSNLQAGLAQLTAAIIKHQPTRPDYYRELAAALENSGQVVQAIPYYRMAIERNPQPAPDLRQLGAALRRSGQRAEAAQALRKSAALAPADPLTWHELGLAYQSLGQSANAIAAFTKAIEIDPGLPEAHNNLGILWTSINAPARAESAFREAIRIRPSYADAHGNLANLLAHTGNFQEATEHFATALQLHPHDAPTRYNYALLLGRTKYYDQAQHELEASLRDDPDFTDAHQLLGDLLVAKNQPRDAVPHYLAVLQKNSSSAQAHLQLGAALAAAGDATNARMHLQQAAASADPQIRDQATGLLQQLGK